MYLFLYEITGEFKLKATSESHKSNLPLKAGPAMATDQVLQCFIHPGLEKPPCWRLHKLFRQPDPLLDCPKRKEIILKPGLISHFSLCLLSCPLTTGKVWLSLDDSPVGIGRLTVGFLKPSPS